LVDNRKVILEIIDHYYNKLATPWWHNELYHAFWALDRNLIVDEITIGYIDNRSNAKLCVKNRYFVKR
jgi:hypothetical protein